VKPSSIRRELLSTNPTAKRKFLENNGVLFDQFCLEYASAMDSVVSFKRQMDNPRHARVEMFLLGAFNSLLVSTKLLTICLLVPAGNLMRQFAEAMAMAMLCASNQLNIFERVEIEKEKFPYHDSIRLISTQKSIRALQLEAQGLENNRKVGKLFEHYSHAGIFSLNTFYDNSKGNKPTLGVFFDSGRQFIYEKEMKNRVSACSLLDSSIAIIKLADQKNSRKS
jgi:hypothetical protein